MDDAICFLDPKNIVQDTNVIILCALVMIKNLFSQSSRKHKVPTNGICTFVLHGTGVLYITHCINYYYGTIDKLLLDKNLLSACESYHHCIESTNNTTYHNSDVLIQPCHWKKNHIIIHSKRHTWSALI